MKTSKSPSSHLPRRLQQSRSSVKRRLLVESLCDRRVLATITGMVFEDVDASWRRDAQEAPLAQRLVFLDQNDNGLPDDGESFALTDPDGGFSLTALSDLDMLHDLDTLGDDAQIVRLFSGTSSQQVHFPVAPQLQPARIALGDDAPTPVADSLRIDAAGDRALLRTSDAVVLVDLAAQTAQTIPLAASPVASEFLPDGRVLVLAAGGADDALLIDPQGQVVAVDLLQAPSPADGSLEGTHLSQTTNDPSANGRWAAVAIDADGLGILVPTSESADASEPVVARKLVIAEDQIGSLPTASEIAAGASVTTGGAVTTVIAEPHTDGLAVSLWSNSSGTMISPQPVTLPQAAEVLAYSDASGLVFAYTPPAGDAATGSVQVLDAAADFALLQTLTGVGPLISVDTERLVLFSYAPGEALLRAVDALSAETLSEWPIEIEAVGAPIAMQFSAATDTLLVIGSAGLASIALDRSDAHRVRVGGAAAPYPLRFAARTHGENTPPQWIESLQFEVTQGESLRVPSGGLLAAANDLQGDPLVVLRGSSPQHGAARVTPHGGLTYTPDAGFSGNDSFEVFLHDGRGASAWATVQLTVNPPPVPDPELNITIYPVPENAHPGYIAGEVDLVALGGGPWIFEIADPRFQVVDGTIVVAADAVLDYEDQWLISTTLTATDQVSGESVSGSFTVQLSDEDDPIEAILPATATVYENVAGELIAELMVIDQDAEQPFILTVDDDRFEIVNRNLRLKPGISLDYEAGAEVVVQITATDAWGGGDSLTSPLTITVLDVAEQAGGMSLSGNIVMELVSGAEVGQLSVDGYPLPDSYTASVDDSRFEIVDGVLKLRADQFLSFNIQQEAQVVISVQDVGAVYPPISAVFLIEVLQNENPFHNSDNPYDVNGDGSVTPLDALLILNAMGRNGGGGPISAFPAPGRFWDVNGDGLITPLDALLIINYINRQNRQSGLGERPSDPTPPPPADQSPLAPLQPEGEAVPGIQTSSLPQTELSPRRLTASGAVPNTTAGASRVLPPAQSVDAVHRVFAPHQLGAAAANEAADEQARGVDETVTQLAWSNLRALALQPRVDR